MNSRMVVRKETDSDIAAIREVTASAFETLEISDHTEPFIVEALRAADALTVSLVAEVEGVPPEVFFALSFGGPVPRGTVTFHDAFKAEGPPAGADDA